MFIDEIGRDAEELPSLIQNKKKPNGGGYVQTTYLLSEFKVFLSDLWTKYVCIIRFYHILSYSDKSFSFVRSDFTRVCKVKFYPSSSRPHESSKMNYDDVQVK